MLERDEQTPNRHQYEARQSGKYLSSRLLTHNGVTIAFALGRSAKNEYFFDYSVLNAEDQDPNPQAVVGQDASSVPAEKLDSQCWLDNPRPLFFSSQLRVAGEEAVPVYQIPPVDRTGRSLSIDRLESLDQWRSTTLSLMDHNVINFEVVSDGRYVYLFRQSRAASDTFLNSQGTTSGAAVPPIDSNLLCDRYNLVGSTLNRTLEVRYRRSRQKRLPLNEQDTLAVQDIDDNFFFEPTVSLRFLSNLVDGRFTVLRTPTMVNNVMRWMFFTASGLSKQIECFITDAASDGLFDIHGSIYYTCSSDDHDATFSNAPGACPALTNKGESCGQVKQAIIPKQALSERAVFLYKASATATLSLLKPITLSGTQFASGFTIETWIAPVSFWVPATGSNTAKPMDEPNTDQQQEEAAPALPEPGSAFCIFSLKGENQTESPSVYMDDRLRLALRNSGDGPSVLVSEQRLDADTWNHVAMTYDASTRTYTLVVNGTDLAKKSYVLPQGGSPGSLVAIASHGGSFRFQGQIDEVRLWRHPLHPATIKAKMSTRATGLEPLLAACWHLDEGTGTQAFDATPHGHAIDIKVEEPREAALKKLWTPSEAPIVNNFGLAKRTVRLSPGVTVEGGLGAALYHEQVSVSQDSGSDKKKEDPKPLKRGARVLLSFVAGLNNSNHVAALDFGLLSDGMLCDFPPILGLPGLFVSPESQPRITSSKIYVDAQGMETYGGVLNCEAAKCAKDPPSVWNSATGTITVFFRHSEGRISALTYDIARRVEVTSIPQLSDNQGVLAATKMRQAVKIKLETSACDWAPESTAVDLVLSATMADGAVVTEQWLGLPSDLEGFCDVLAGSDTAARRKLGTLAKYLKADPPANPANPDMKACFLGLTELLKFDVPQASCIVVGGRHFQVLAASKVGDTRILVSSPYAKTSPNETLPGKNLPVILVGYDHKELVSCDGKPTGDFTQGSSIVSFNPMDRQSGTDLKKTLVKTKVTFEFAPPTQTPSFVSPEHSTALKLTNGRVYSMLETGVTTTATPGVTFESWIKVDKALDSVIAAYTSERAPRSERSGPEQQSFVLAVRKSCPDSSNFELQCNANGAIFSVRNSSAFQENKWLHFACSTYNTFALQFQGSNYVDLSNAPDFNVSDFALAFTLCIDQMSRDQVLFTKSNGLGSVTPIHLTLTSQGRLSLCYWAEDENTSKPRQFVALSDDYLQCGIPYKVFISRQQVRVKSNYNPSMQGVPRSIHLTTMRVWDSTGNVATKLEPPSISTLEKNQTSSPIPPLDDGNGSAQACGVAQPNEAPLTFGGAPWATEQGLVGSIGPVQIYSAAIPVPSSPTDLCKQPSSERSRIAAWFFKSTGGVVLQEQSGRLHGKLKRGPDWVLSKFQQDHRKSVYVNGQRAEVSTAVASPSIGTPVGAHQLTLGNTIHGDDRFRFLAMRDCFQGELDELRIWNVPRTKENITDMMNSRLSEVSSDLAVYMSFDPSSGSMATSADPAVLLDSSINCWHLTPLHEFEAMSVNSAALVSQDAPCVEHVLSKTKSDLIGKSGAKATSHASVTEYGDMQISATGGMEGSYKRAYSYIEEDGKWSLVTGFKIGTLITEWVSQVQTAPTLIGYIEGAPPIPAENYLGKEDRPSTSIRFSNAGRCTYTYSSRGEVGADMNVSASVGLGAKWDVSAGMGVETQVSAGEIKGAVKTNVDISGSAINNAVTATTTNTNLEMRVELTGAWSAREGNKPETFEAANTGLALVESEVADVYALRLKIRGAAAPLVAYQLRPNPDIPKDRNLVSFPINKSYTKQGCLDGRRGLDHDEDFPPATEAPTDASYYKPIEAYALKDKIRRQQEQLQGEFDRASLMSVDRLFKLPTRTHRNICNSYVWTADGGTFQETTSLMDTVQTEIGGSLNAKASIGISADLEVSAGSLLATCNVDALLGVHANLTQTKELSSETSFELQADLPSAIDIRQRDQNTGKWVKRPGAVDAYRWMSFWLEGSVEGTEAFFRQVVDPKWLEDGQEPSAKLLLQLRDKISKESGHARTKAWRVLHRCTYISRVPEKIAANLALEASTPQPDEKKSLLLADVACNWNILQNLEPVARGAASRTELAHLAQPVIAKLYPTIRSQPRYNQQILDLLGDYIGMK